MYGGSNNSGRNLVKGIYEQSINEAGFELFPNPAGDIVHFLFNQNQPVISARIINLSGQTVFIADEIKNNRLNLGFLNNGVYLLEIGFANNKKAIQKLMVKK